jgi:hypothetical protein
VAIVRLTPGGQGGPGATASSLAPDSRLRGKDDLLPHLRDHEKQIGVIGLLTGSSDQRMRLTAVMRLMIEEMRDEQGDQQPGRPGIAHEYDGS